MKMCFDFLTGLESNRDVCRGKMDLRELIVRFHQSGIGLMSFKLRIKLGVSFTSHLSISKELLVVLVPSLLTRERLFQSLSQLQKAILPLRLAIGTRGTTRLVVFAISQAMTF